MKKFAETFDSIISAENLFAAWEEFVRGKRGKHDVQEFQANLADNVLKLHHDLASGAYCHGSYEHFTVTDPKRRDIHKASVRDRLLHHAVYRIFYPFYDSLFITDSYSCRKNKGTHRAMNRFRHFARRVSENHTRTCRVLKCDVRKFFASIDHATLLSILRERITDERAVLLCAEIINSFHAVVGKGLPLGNLTSQLFANIYMNEFDRLVKYDLKAKFYIRYADDFVILSRDRYELTELLQYIVLFLEERLKLELHADKIFLKTLASGVDFLGWVHFPDHWVLRTTTKRRMLRRMERPPLSETAASYRGMLGHGNAWKLVKVLESVD